MIGTNSLIPLFGGFQTILAPVTVAGFVSMALLSVLAVLSAFGSSPYKEHIDRSLFWVVGLLLVGFAVFRPIGLARDDQIYVGISNAMCPLGDCVKEVLINRDYIWHGLNKLGLMLFSQEGVRIAFVLSGIGVFIKLFVFDKLCRQRLFALLLYIPICYVQYDLTQFRAGFAISYMLLGVMSIARSRIVVGSVILCTNFAVHSQAIPSPGLLTYRIFGLGRWILPVGIIFLLILLWGDLYPGQEILKVLGSFPDTAGYVSGMQAGDYRGVKVFPLAYLAILAYGVLLCSTCNSETRKLGEIVAASLFLGTALTWFFAVIPTMQTRLFEFYVVPLVLLAGNVGASRSKIAATCILALMLYMRLELLHDWILG
jgi:hypothetical protein